MLIGMIMCAVLAAGGISFGVWTVVDGNTQKDNLNKQISTLKAQNSELIGQIVELESDKAEDEGELTSKIEREVAMQSAYVGVLSGTDENDSLAYGTLGELEHI